MKTFRYIGMALLAIMLCVGFVACSSDDDDETASAASALVGTEWQGKNGVDCVVLVKITSSTQCNVTVYYPNSTKVYNNKVCTYVYDESTGRFILNYSDDIAYDDYAMQGIIKGNILTVTDKYSTYTLRRK